MKYFLSSLVFLSSFAYAMEVPVLDIPARDVRSNDEISTRFSVDPTTGEGNMNLTVQRTQFRHIPSNPGDVDVSVETILYKSVKVAGLKLIGEELIFQKDGESVVCGEMGLSRYRRKPTLYLTGRCYFSDKILSQGTQRILKVSLIVE